MSNNINFPSKIKNLLLPLLLAALFTLPVSGCGTEELQVYKVGDLSGTDVFLVIADGFKAEMVKLGYVEGENISYAISANDFIKMGEMAAPLADKIFKGTQADSIPVVTPEQDMVF